MEIRTILEGLQDDFKELIEISVKIVRAKGNEKELITLRQVFDSRLAEVNLSLAKLRAEVYR